MRIEILVIDDDEDILFMAQKYLTKMDSDFRIVPATSAQDALRIIDSATVDAIICDFYLGPDKMNGLELLEWIREEGLTIPFIIFTGRSREEVAIQALNLGADYYLEKSSDLGGLFAEISHHIKNVVHGRKTEEALKESEQKYRTLVNSIEDMIFVLDSNNCFSDYHSLPRDDLIMQPSEFLGRHVSDVLPEPMCSLYLENVALVRSEGKRRSFDYSMTMHGKETWYEAHLDLHEDGESIVVTARNITTRKQYEKEIIEAERQWRDTFNSIPDFVSVHDIDCNLVKINESLLRFIRKKKEDVIGRKCYEVIHYTPEAPENCPYAKTIATEETQSAIVRDPKSGCPLLVTTSPVYDEAGSLAGVIHVAKDMSDQFEITKHLEESETRFKATFENAGVGIMLASINQEILETNAVFQRFIGYTKEELQYMNVKQLAFSGEVEEEIRMATELYLGERSSFQMEGRYMRKDGQAIWGRLTLSYVKPTDNSHEGYFIGIVEDINEQKITEALLHREQAKAQEYLNLAGAVILATDENQNITLLNRFGCNLLGYNEDEVIGKNWIESFLPQERRERIRGYMQSILDGNAHPMEFEPSPVLTSEGETKWIQWSDVLITDSDGGGKRILSAGTDVTSQIIAKHELERSEARFRAIFEDAGMGMTVVDVDDNIIECNPAFQRLIGYSLEELRNTKIADYVHPDDTKTDIMLFTEILERKRDSYRMKKRYYRKDGTEVLGDLVVTCVRDDDGNVLYAMGMVEDITSRREAEKRIRKDAERTKFVLELYHSANDLSEHDLFDYVLKNIMALTDSPIGFFHRVSPDQKGIMLELWHPDTLQVCQVPYETYCTIEQAGSWADAFRQKRPIVYNSYDESLSWKGLPSDAVSVTRYLSIPIMKGKDVAFIVGVGNKPEDYDRQDLLQIHLIANELSQIINQRASEEELAEEERKFRLLFENAPIGCALVDIRGDIFTSNKALSDILGYSPEELQQMNVEDFTYHDDWVCEKELDDEVIDGRRDSYTIDKRFYHKQGHIVWGRLSVSITRNPTKNQMLAVGMVEDITKERETAKGILQSQQNLFSLFDSVNEYLWVIGLDGNLINMNETVVRKLGFTREELLGQPAVIVHPADQREEAAKTLQRMMEGSETICPIPLCTKDGRIIEVDTVVVRGEWNGEAALFGVSRDVTKQRMNECALRESEQKYRALFEKIDEAVLIISLDGTLVEMNDQARRILGNEAEDTIGQAFWTNILSNSRDELREQMARLIAAGNLPTFRQRIHTRARGVLNLEISASLALDSKGNPLHVQCIVRPIAEGTNDAIDESERSHRKVVESMNDMIFVLDGQNRYTEVYASTGNLLHFRPEVFLGRHVSDLLPPDVAEPFIKVAEIVRTTGKSETYEYSLQIEGQEYWFESCLSLHEEGKSIVSDVRNITERKRIEIKLEAQNRFLGKVIDSLPHPFYVIDASNYNVRLANEAARIYEEPGVSTCYEMTHHRTSHCTGDDHPCPLKQVMEGREPTVVEHEHIDNEGRRRSVDVHGYPIFDNTGNVIEMIEYAIDVTEHKQALRALEESEERFRVLFEKAPLAYQTLDRDGYILDVNGAWLDTLGYNRSDVIGKRFVEFMTSSSSREFQIGFARLKEQGFIRDVEFDLIRQDGSQLTVRINGRITFDEQGNFKQTHFIFQDISEWKKAEATIKREHDRAEMYLNIAPVIIVALDLEGNVMLLNKRGQETTGYSEDEIIGKNWFDVAVPQWEKQPVRHSFEQIISGNLEPAKKVENRIATKNGSELLIDWYNSILRDDNNTIIGTLSAGEDITQKRMADDLLKKQKDELSELAHTMSHDLGNKLKSINSLVSLLKSEYDEEMLDRISTIALQSIDLLQTSADLADAGAIIQTKERVDLETVVRNTAATVLPSSVRLLTSNLHIVAGSPQRIEQIFQNLFTNAVEHGDATEIRVEGKWESTGYCIYISNNGKPIPCDVRDKIFDRSFTTKQNGRGLGLAIIKKLVDAHGWDIVLYDCSTATFRVCTTSQS